MNKKNVPLQWHTEKRTVDSLTPYEKNPRQMSEKQLADLKKSLKRFNLVEIPAVDTDNKVIAGHQRLKVLHLLDRGGEEIDVRVPNRPLTKDEYEQYLLTSNAVTGDWDFEKLKSFDMDLLLDVGFDADELSSVWEPHLEVQDEKGFDEESELEKITEPETQLGDLIELGTHRLICGDNTDVKVLEQLCGKEKVSMIYSDPVFNLKGALSYSVGIGGKKNYGGNVNDTRSDEEYERFLRQGLELALAHSKPDTHCFYWNDQCNIGITQALYKSLGITNKRVCLWIKNSQNPTPSVAFNKCYEACMYGVRGKPYLSENHEGLNEVMNAEMSTGNNLHSEIYDQLDLWLEKRLPAKDYEHATSKPPALHQKSIRRCTKPGDIILDSFGGSGRQLTGQASVDSQSYLNPYSSLMT